MSENLVPSYFLECLLYKGYVKSSFDEHAAEQSASLKISQTWTSMMVILETEHSRSESLSASVLTKNPRDVRISYEYLNQPGPADFSQTYILASCPNQTEQ